METVKEILYQFPPDTWVDIHYGIGSLNYTDTNKKARIKLDDAILNSKVAKWKWNPERNSVGTLEISL